MTKPNKPIKQILTPDERLRKVIDEAYAVFCQQVTGGI